MFLAALGALALAPGAVAQTPSPTPSPAATPTEGDISLQLVDQPVGYGPDDRLSLEIRITNRGTTPLEGFQLIVGVDDRVTSRSQLRETFDGEVGLLASSRPFPFDDSVPPQGDVVVTVDDPVSSFPTLGLSEEGGVFPAAVVLRTADGLQVLETLSIPFIYYPRPPQTRINLAVLLPLNAIPERSAGGGFEPDEDGLAEAVQSAGWLRGFTRALQRATRPRSVSTGRGRGNERELDPLRLTVAPTPRMIEELSDMADGYVLDGEEVPEDAPEAEAAADILGRLEALFAGSDLEPALVPYAFPDLPTSLAELPQSHTFGQLSAAGSVLSTALGIEAEGIDWLFPPAGRLDAESLAEIQSLPAIYDVFLSTSSLEEPVDTTQLGCPEEFASFACAVEVRASSQGSSNALVADEGLTDQLSNLLVGTNDRLSLQRFFAETSMIREELPGVPNRVVQATVPSLWHPRPRLARLFLDGIREAPWIRSVTATEAVEGSPEIVERAIVERAPAIRSQPTEAFFDEVLDATRMVEQYESIVPPNNQRIIRLSRNVLTAASRSWWRRQERAYDYLADSTAEVERELDKISLRTVSFTFTDREGDLQFSVVNETAHPVKLALSLRSEGNMTFDRPSFVEVFRPGAQAVTVEATARTSGSFPVEVRMSTPDGLLIEEATINIRSTSLNKIALIITVGALAFLILFYVLRAIRRRSPADEVTV